MTMQEIYKSRKAALALRIKESKSLYETGSVISEAFETMLYQYLADSRNRIFTEKVTGIVTLAKNSFPLVESVNKYKIWEGADNRPPKKKSPMPGLIAFLIGFLMIFIPPAYYMFLKNIKLSEVQTYMYVMAAGCFVILISGFMLFFRRKQKVKTNVEIYVDAEDITNRLEDVVKQIDALIELEKQAAEQQEKLIRSSITEDEVRLFSYLMEAKLSGDGEFALEQLDEVARYLAKQDVLIVNYTKGNEKYFEFLEGEETKTIRPAFIRGGNVMKMGLAQISGQ